MSRDKDYYKSWRAQRSPEQVEKHRAKARERARNRSEEQKARRPSTRRYQQSEKR